MINTNFYKSLIAELEEKKCQLLAVSKTKPVEDIKALYDLGQRLFGENKVQEILAKQPLLPADIEWHLIGSLQSNKVKQIIPHIALIHSMDSVKLWEEIDKQSAKENLHTKVLIQIKIAKEETKSGFEPAELLSFLASGAYIQFKNVQVCGVMGMASFVEDEKTIRAEFRSLKQYFDLLKDSYFKYPEFKTISMGMSGDYQMAIEEGSNMVRIGSSLFGSR